MAIVAAAYGAAPSVRDPQPVAGGTTGYERIDPIQADLGRFPAHHHLRRSHRGHRLRDETRPRPCAKPSASRSSPVSPTAEGAADPLRQTRLGTLRTAGGRPGAESPSPRPRLAQMPKPLTQTLTPEKALIFRRTHCRNVPWILRNGLHCRRSNRPDPDFVGLGNPDLIERRPHRPVPIDPGGTLDDYLRFDFTPFSPMLDNIRTGYGGIGKRRSEEIVILVSSLPALEEKNIRYVFTDRHAFLQSALFFSHRGELGNVAWDLLRRRDLPRDPEEPTKLERYQAEALVYRFLPVDGLLGLACSTAGVQRELDADLGELGLDLKTVVRPGWYFR